MHIALIGYGEVGRIVAEELRAGGHDLTAFDLKLRTADGTPIRAHALAHRVTLAESHQDAVRRAELTISAVTASQTVAAAASSAGGLLKGSFFLDLNSASPGAKMAAAEPVESAGGRYVEGAVMTSVPPHRLKVPLLLGGPHAGQLQLPLNELGFAAQVASRQLGVASATKMCRSVMIKGLEAMVVESFVAARRHGVEEAVLASLRETFPGVDWDRQASYFFGRVIVHGRRRAEEMREAAATVREAGLEPLSAAGTAERQAWLADLADAGIFGDRSGKLSDPGADWRVEADRILEHLKGSTES